MPFSPAFRVWSLPYLANGTRFIVVYLYDGIHTSLLQEDLHESLSLSDGILPCLTLEHVAREVMVRSGKSHPVDRIQVYLPLNAL
jgi:hypothetical protein